MQQYIYYIFNVVSKTGELTYNEITAFLKQQPNTITQYKSIKTVNKTITLTENHLIYGRKNSAKQFIPM